MMDPCEQEGQAEIFSAGFSFFKWRFDRDRMSCRLWLTFHPDWSGSGMRLGWWYAWLRRRPAHAATFHEVATQSHAVPAPRSLLMS